MFRSFEQEFIDKCTRMDIDDDDDDDDDDEVDDEDYDCNEGDDGIDGDGISIVGGGELKQTPTDVSYRRGIGLH